MSAFGIFLSSDRNTLNNNHPGACITRIEMMWKIILVNKDFLDKKHGNQKISFKKIYKVTSGESGYKFINKILSKLIIAYDEAPGTWTG